MTKFAVQSSWDETPHLSDAAKATLLESIPEYQRDARTKGIPQLGSGAIYPVPESEVLVDPFEIPAYFRQAYGFDVGWNKTAAVWGALDADADVLYLHSEHYRGHVEPPVHAAAIRARGTWIPGVIDPASRGRGQKDGDQLLRIYRELGLETLTTANPAVDSGLYDTWVRLSTGRLKVFRTLQNWLGEFRIYRRNEKGAVVKENDHLMDATRYLVVSGIARATVRPPNMWPQKNKSGHQIEYNPLPLR